jgi:hypothetical protein
MKNVIAAAIGVALSATSIAGERVTASNEPASRPAPENYLKL